jgi:mono/diheme cytochrome c family protein
MPAPQPSLPPDRPASSGRGTAAYIRPTAWKTAASHHVSPQPRQPPPTARAPIGAPWLAFALRLFAPLCGHLARVPRLVVSACVAASALALPAAAAERDGLAFFEQKIRPVLAEHCYECHSERAKKVKGGLLLDTKAGWQKGGDSGAPAIIPGKPDDSLLLRVVRHLEDDLAMPPKKPPLPAANIADLAAWIAMGAPDPRDGAPVAARRGDKSWWSLQPLATRFAHDSIDGFVAEKLAARQLAFNPPADPRTLIRRMTYDLHGLPPTADEVAAFVSASIGNPQSAIENLVDRLLASPRYGERWGRHWLDVVRFGESNGFERNVIIDDLWPFRDFVIRSLNADKPFDRFIAEHLAGDILAPGDPAVEVGAAFLVAGPYDDVKNQDVAAQAAIRAATLDDVVVASSGAFLGLTVGCARCHHHKFDPIPTEDYYRLRSAFEGVNHGRRVVATPAERDAFTAATKPLNARRAKLVAERDAIERAVTQRAKAIAAATATPRPKIDPDGTEEKFPAVAARHVRFVMSASTTNPKSAVGSRLTEFEVWSAGASARNVALAAHGAKAEGTKSSTAEDFPEAYGVQHVIDGRHGEQWFIGNPAVLTVTLARAETIERIVFRNAKETMIEDKAQGATPADYEVQVSLDGETWRTVATGADRQPWSEAHAIERHRAAATTPEERGQLAAVTPRLAAVDRELRAVPPLRQVWVGKPAQPTEATRVHKGGDPMKPGDSVAPASLAVLGHALPDFALAPDAPEGERRRALADWIVHPANPLTPRVLANRVWQYHFGTGIVDTPSDFGFLGGLPSHPELLDFLARRLLAHGWRLKALHREILLSRTYRQSAAHRADAARTDGESRLLWRFPPRRLSAEEIRDTMLTVAGKLQLEPMGGPGFRLYKFTQNNVCTYFPLDHPGPETYRRAVYHQNARASVVDVLSDFDFPDIALAAPRRANTTTPLQALTLLNHRFTLDLASALAARLDPADPIAHAYALAFQRPPTAAEKSAAAALIAAHGRDAFCRALLNANELLYLE